MHANQQLNTFRLILFVSCCRRRFFFFSVASTVEYKGLPCGMRCNATQYELAPFKLAVANAQRFDRPTEKLQNGGGHKSCTERTEGENPATVQFGDKHRQMKWNMLEPDMSQRG